jgi:hypothetical protein
LVPLHSLMEVNYHYGMLIMIIILPFPISQASEVNLFAALCSYDFSYPSLFLGWAKPHAKQYQGDVSLCSMGVDRNYSPSF